MASNGDRPTAGEGGFQADDQEFELDWNLSPYTFERDDSSLSRSSTERGTPIILDLAPSEEGSQRDEEGNATPASGIPINGEDGEPVIVSMPPVSHLGGSGGLQGYYNFDDGEDDEEDSESDDDDLFLVESKSIRDDRTVFGRALTLATVSESQSIMYEDNKEQAANATKLVDKITTVPLSEFWHRFTQVFFLAVFLTNVIVALVDVVLYPYGLYFKITTIVMGVVENILLLTMWILMHWRKKRGDAEDTFTKHQQYIENIVHEVLLYPIIIMATLGFSSDKMYREPSTILGWVQLILLAIDVLDLMWTQTVRIFMIYQNLREVALVLAPEESGSCCSMQFAGSLMPRAFAAIVGNTVLFLVLIFVMGAQMNDENYTTTDYHMEYRSGLQAVCLIVLPLYSLFMFVVANSYWVIEFMITLNLKIGTSSDFRKNFEDDAIMNDAVGFCLEKAETTKERLNDIQSLSVTKKVTYALSELPVLLLLLVWEGLVWIVAFSFDAFPTDWENWSVRGAFLFTACMSNGQLLLLSCTMNILTPVMGVAGLLYPLSLTLCFWKRQTIEPEDEDQAFIMGKELKQKEV